MNFRSVLFPLPPPTAASAGLLLLRVFAGLSLDALVRSRFTRQP